MTRPNVDVAALAKLARLEISAGELVKLEKEIPSILAFIDTIQSASAKSSGMPKEAGLVNVMRMDENPHESGTYTEKLLSAAPVREGDRIAVKQVISRKK